MNSRCSKPTFFFFFCGIVNLRLNLAAPFCWNESRSAKVAITMTSRQPKNVAVTHRSARLHRFGESDDFEFTKLRTEKVPDSTGAEGGLFLKMTQLSCQLEGGIFFSLFQFLLLLPFDGEAPFTFLRLSQSWSANEKESSYSLTLSNYGPFNDPLLDHQLRNGTRAENSPSKSV